ncbi:MAG: GGDEF domain-containing protein [Helicobacteraceae bacterium]|nr:GGDEF domain-containing protein [Helicobacteraceae bacterium]
MFKPDRRALIAILLYLVWIVYFTVDAYYTEKRHLIEDIDATLLQSAMSIPILLPEGFHHKGMNADSVSAKEDWSNIIRLSQFADIVKLKYLYSMILVDGKTFFTASNGTEEERSTKVNLVTYFEYYDDAPSELHKAFESGEISYVEYRDKWGYFRSVFVPMTSKDGLCYIVAADIDISNIETLLRNSLLKNLFYGALFLLFIIPFQIAYNWRMILANKMLEKTVSERTQELQSKNDETQEILNSSSDIIMLTDGERIDAANTAFHKFFGTTSLAEFDARGLKLSDYLLLYRHNDDKEKHFQPLEWIEKMKNLPDNDRLVTLKSESTGVHSVFRININPAGKRFVVSLTDVTQLTRTSEQYRYLATHDPLTSCFNRNYLEAELADSLARVKRYHSAVSVAMLDIDHFKEFNDNYGHLTGDVVLIGLSDLITISIRSCDLFARWGGEEFVLLLPDSDLESAHNAADKLRLLVAETDFPKAPTRLTISIGVTQLAEDDTIKSIMERVDHALYSAKARGRNRVVSQPKSE